MEIWIDDHRELIQPVVRGVEWAGSWEEFRTTAKATQLISFHIFFFNKGMRYLCKE